MMGDQFSGSRAMSKAATSVFVFSIYLFILGAVLVVVPNTLLALFGLPETNEVWVRVVGMLVVILGYYYLTAARNELTAFLRATVYGRFAVLLFFVAFVVFGFAPPILILFGAIDAAAAGWTGMALRSADTG
jgi:hypothetical protein